MAEATDTAPVAKAAPPGPPVAPNGPLGGSVAMTGDANAGAFGEIGVSGLKVASGYVLEEFQNELRGSNAVRVYRQMSEADSTVNAVLTAIGLVLRAVDWRVEPADDSGEAEKEAEFVESLLDDMSHPFTDVVGEALSMLVYGWSALEIVLKRRNGPDQKDPAQRSKFDDGRIGIRKLPLRSQDSLLRWEMQDDGGISGLWQLPPMGGGQLYIPIERMLLFRTTSRKGSPEGVSILRAAYKPWWLRKTVEEMEAIGIERELAGLPVVSIPSEFLAANASAAHKTVLADWKKVARDVKFNQQGGIVKPSDLWRDKEGNPVAEPMFKVELLSTGGRRAIDTGPVVERHEKNIARSALADFMMLGDQKGSYALSKNKSELFLRACESYLNQIAEVLNRFLIPRIWNYNNLNRDLMPELKPGRVAPVDLAEFGAYLQALAASGAPIWPNQDLLEYSMEIADAPAPPEDAGVNLQTGDNQDTSSNTGKPVGDASESDAATSFMSGTNTAKSGGDGDAEFPFDKGFNPGEPRDDAGRWTNGGGAVASALSGIEPQWGKNKRKNAELAAKMAQELGFQAEVYSNPKSNWAAAWSQGKININSAHKFWSDPVGSMQRQFAAGALSSDNPSHVVFHEAGHAMYDAPDNWFGNVTGQQDIARAQVSRYAATNPKEFVSEVHAGMKGGRTFGSEVMHMFRQYARPRQA